MLNVFKMKLCCTILFYYKLLKYTMQFYHQALKFTNNFTLLTTATIK